MSRNAQPVEPIEHRTVEHDVQATDDDREAPLHELRCMWLARHGVAKAVQSAIAEIAFQVAARAGE